MNIQKIGKLQIIMQNPGSKHGYFGWPSVARLQNGKIAVVASGFRLRHVCPFGKAVIAYSEDEGQTYSRPAPVIDTVLDDRDSGILPFGERQVIVTSFNNTVEFQRRCAAGEKDAPYVNTYLDTLTPEEEAAAIGATFRFSDDCGVTFGPIQKSPVTSPHGPTVLKDGSLLWVGRTFSPANAKTEYDRIEAHKVYPDGRTEYVGYIENIEVEGMNPLSCEPHALVLEDGRILVHFRVQGMQDGIWKLYTVYQSESEDNGKNWSKPHPVLPACGGAPAHLIRHSSGLLISTYGFRGTPYGSNPCGIRVMFSADNGTTWQIPDDFLYESDRGPDLGYPATVELSDGSLLTVFYASTETGSPTVIMQQKWRIENEI